MKTKNKTPPTAHTEELSREGRFDFANIKFDLGRIFHSKIILTEDGNIEGNPMIHAMAEYVLKLTKSTPQPLIMKGQYKEVMLCDLPNGSLFKCGDTYGLKTEYNTDKGAIEAFIIGSGEMFWGGTNDAESQRKILVQEINFKP